MKKDYLKQDPKVKKKLKKYGKTITTIGVILFAIAILSFFSAMQGGGMPRYFFLGFIGLPMIGIGSAMLRYGYMGEVARYTSSEVAPVAKDTINYMLDETKENVADFVQTIKGKEQKEKLTCPYCHDLVEQDEVFCDKCGRKLHKVCQSCGTKHFSTSEFCKKCGKRLYD